MHLILLLLTGIALWLVLHRAGPWGRGEVICRNCGSRGQSKIDSPRSLVIEILLWFSYLIPGVIYTLWCKHHTRNVCAKCGASDIVPVDSPVGRKLAGETHTDATPISQSLGRK